ncbi:MAG: hypothetical protein JXB88_01850 [Spirochaetales bacterium]|nr:hypothetical protein [Spirochaetales bacterium]
MITLPAFFFISVFFLFSCFEEKREQNVLESVTGELSETNPSIICFKEVCTIPVPLLSPHGIAVGEDATMYITGDRKLIIMDKDGNLEDQLKLDKDALALAVFSQNTYLGYADYVEKINLLTKQRYTWAPLGEHALITSIAANNDYVFVADAGNHLVYCYDTEGTLKKLITGEEKNGIPHFMIFSPYFDIAACPDNTFWVTNPGRFRVEHWSAKGDFLSQWGSPGGGIDTFSGCCNPVHITLLPTYSEDNKGSMAIITAEKGIPRVKQYHDSGDFRCIVAPPSLFRTGTKQLDLAANANGRVYVLDPENNIIRVFEDYSTFVEAR